MDTGSPCADCYVPRRRTIDWLSWPQPFELHSPIRNLHRGTADWPSDQQRVAREPLYIGCRSCPMRSTICNNSSAPLPRRRILPGDLDPRPRLSANTVPQFHFTTPANGIAEFVDAVQITAARCTIGAQCLTRARKPTSRVYLPDAIKTQEWPSPHQQITHFGDESFLSITRLILTTRSQLSRERKHRITRNKQIKSIRPQWKTHKRRSVARASYRNLFISTVDYRILYFARPNIDKSI